VSKKRPKVFQGRHFEDVMIVLCVRWYLRYSLSYRNLKKIMAERGLMSPFGVVGSNIMDPS
jgi:transposase-like protein